MILSIKAKNMAMIRMVFRVPNPVENFRCIAVGHPTRRRLCALFPRQNAPGKGEE